MLVPLSLQDEPVDKPVGGSGIGNSQQRFRKAHQHYTFARTEIVFLKKSVQSSAHGRLADLADQIERPLLYFPLQRLLERGSLQQRFETRCFVRKIRRTDRALRRIERRRIGGKNEAHCENESSFQGGIIPLFATRFPLAMDLSRFPRIKLCHTPTPLEAMPRLSRHLGGPQIYIKRDDCTGLGLG